jgi:hypothetical protein
MNQSAVSQSRRKSTDHLRALVMTAVLGWPALGAAQVSPAPANAAAKSPSVALPNTLELLTAASGTGSCVPLAREVGTLLVGAPGTHAAVPMQPAQPQDGRMVSATVERHDADNHTRIVSTWLSPTQAGGCDVGYEVVTFWKKSCQDVMLLDMGVKTARVIARDVQVVLHKPNHHLYLMRVPGGCVSINKEMVYR